MKSSWSTGSSLLKITYLWWVVVVLYSQLKPGLSLAQAMLTGTLKKYFTDKGGFVSLGTWGVHWMVDLFKSRFRNLNWRYLPYIRPIFHAQHMATKYGQTCGTNVPTHFRILKSFPLTCWWFQSPSQREKSTVSKSTELGLWQIWFWRFLHFVPYQMTLSWRVVKSTQHHPTVLRFIVIHCHTIM